MAPGLGRDTAWRATKGGQAFHGPSADFQDEEEADTEQENEEEAEDEHEEDDDTQKFKCCICVFEFRLVSCGTSPLPK